MKQKFILALFIFMVSVSYRSAAQCPQPPLYSIATHYTGSGWTFAFTIPQPVCDTILGWQVQWKIQGTSVWSEIRADSLKQVNTSGLWGGHLETALITGSKYQWRDRMIMYKPTGKPAYSSWVSGNAFIPFDPVLPYNTPPDFMDMELPGSTDMLFIIGDNPETGWSIPTQYTLQYRPIGTSSWIKVNGPTPDPPPGAIVPHLSTLTPSTPYEWRIRYQSGAGNNSAWVNGPDFTTTSGSFAGNVKQNVMRKILQFKSSQITHVPEANDLAAADKITGNKLLVSPNPSTGYFVIHYNSNIQQKVNAQLFDANGKRGPPSC